VTGGSPASQLSGVSAVRYCFPVARGLGHLRFECTRCGNCCRRFRVPLTGADLRRLVAGTGLAPAAVTEWLATDVVDMTGEPETFVRFSEGRRLMVLAWADAGCRLLAGDLCSVHPHRPVSCRAYPFHAVLGKRNGIRRLELLDTTECRHTWGTPATQREVANTAAWQRRELQDYARRVQAFNRVQGRLARLGKRLLDVQAFYERLLDARTGVGSKEQGRS
jgi:Fe-S-cluster containining protein